MILNPRNFSNKIDKFLPIIQIVGLISLTIGLYLAFFASPSDYQQGDAVRIMYIHVPAAWLSMAVYSIMAIASIGFLIWSIPILDIIARSIAPIGAAFTLVTLITGSIWGKPMWGTWWVWDARLTSVLILFFLYLGYISLIDLLSDKPNAKAPAILAILGLVNIPIIKFSVDLWNSLHQPASIIRMKGPAIHIDMLKPLLCMFIAYFCYFLWMASINIRAELVRSRIKRILSEM